MGLAIIAIFAYIVFLGLTKSVLYSQTDIETNSTPVKWEYAFLCSFFSLLIIRILLAAFCQGFATDLACWSAWGERVNVTGTSAFYSDDYFCDYPPFYIYVLGILNKFTTLLNLNVHAVDFINKLPAVLCDMFIMALIYITVSRLHEKKQGFLMSVIFALCPIFIYNSSVWGQIESVLLIFLLVSFLELYRKNYLTATLLFAVAVLIKPQGLLLTPVYIFEILSTKNKRTIAGCILWGYAIFMLLSLPFSPAWSESSGFWAFINALNPLWLIDKYLTTLSSYNFFTVNAFNLYGLLGLNWVSLEKLGILSDIISASIIILAVAGGGYIYFKVKDRASKLFLSAYFILGFLYTFAFKMHERYIILPVFFLLAEYLFTKNKRILWLFGGLSSVGFLNTFYILRLTLTGNSREVYGMVAPISILEVLIFVFSVYIIFTEYICPKYKKSFSFSLLPSFRALLTGYAKNGKSPVKNHKMTRTDSIILTVIVLVYSIFAYTNLGDTKAPQTYYKPDMGDAFVITLENPSDISGIAYYCGIGDVGKHPGIQLSHSNDGKNWTRFADNDCTLNSVFKWEYKAYDKFNAKYIKGVPNSTDYTIYEIGFFSPQGTKLKIDSVQGISNTNYKGMTDEQELVTNTPTYMNGTYFDEIYHPRTAYEHLNLMPYYETTHPPLGKLIISLGIATFGMTPFGWRCMGTLVGILMLPIFYLFLKRIFGRTRYAVMGTLLFAFDFMHFSLTRMATIDSYPVLFIICMYYFMYRFYTTAKENLKTIAGSLKKPYIYLLLSGISMGLGCASKWIAVYASIGLAVEFFVIMYVLKQSLKDTEGFVFLPFFIKTCLLCLVFFVAIPFTIYLLSYLPISMTEGYGNLFEAMANNQKYMLNYHSGLNDTHPYSSPWYSWPFVYKPMWAYRAPETSVAENQIGCISIFQNPFLSWISIPAFFYSLYAGFKKKDFRVLFLAIGLLSQYLPWAVISRYALQYHFFATLPFMIIFFIYAICDIEKRLPRFGYVSSAVTALCLVMFICFYPVISGTPVSRFWADTILTWFNSWVFFI